MQIFKPRKRKEAEGMHPLEVLAMHPITEGLTQFPVTASVYANYWRYKTCESPTFKSFNNNGEEAKAMRGLMINFYTHFKHYDIIPFLDWASDNWYAIETVLLDKGRLKRKCGRPNQGVLASNSDLCFAWYEGKWYGRYI